MSENPQGAGPDAGQSVPEDATISDPGDGVDPNSHEPVPEAALEGEEPMAFPTAVNNQITDAVTQSNVKVLGDAPAVALAGLYQAVAQALALSAQNATNAQQQNNILSEAVTARCAQILGAGK